MATEPVRKLSRNAHRQRVHLRVRTRVRGTPERPRLCVYRSNGHIYAQVIDDVEGKTLVSVSTNTPALKETLKKASGNVKGAAALGTAVADLCKKKGITKVVFDRSGYLYHGRVAALADAARQGGLEF